MISTQQGFVMPWLKCNSQRAHYFHCEPTGATLDDEGVTGALLGVGIGEHRHGN